MSRIHRCCVTTFNLATGTIFGTALYNKLYLPFLCSSTIAIMANKEYVHSSCFSKLSDSFVNCFCCCSVASLSCCCNCSTVSWRRDTIAVNTLTSLSPSASKPCHKILVSSLCTVHLLQVNKKVFLEHSQQIYKCLKRHIYQNVSNLSLLGNICIPGRVGMRPHLTWY